MDKKSTENLTIDELFYWLKQHDIPFTYEVIGNEVKIKFKATLDTKGRMGVIYGIKEER